MRIGFINLTPMIYDVETPYIEPLGGSESSMCYLAVELVKIGHSVTLFGRKNRHFDLWGVNHRPDRALINGLGKDLDVLVIQNTPGYVVDFLPYLGKKTKVIFWTQHAPDQPVVACLHDKKIQQSFSAIVYISVWQKEAYDYFFKLSIPHKILRNAVSPVFENLFKSNQKILDVKESPPLLAYTSTPFRGLEVLVNVFPKIRSIFPDIKLKVFSSMRVYQEMFSRDLYRNLYTQLGNMEGVSYVGSLSQRDLAKEMVGVSILAYPNTFRETSCISVMEAMASGSRIVTTNLAALPETTAGFGRLVDTYKSQSEYEDKYTQELLEEIDSFYSRQRFLERDIRNQVSYVMDNYIWKKRAGEWEEFLERF